MRVSTLLASLAIAASTASAQSITQLLTSSHIVDMTTVDTNTNTEMNVWRQYQSVSTDSKTNVRTTIVTKQLQSMPFNQTIEYEQVQLSGTGGSALQGPIYDYSADSIAQSLTGARQWTSCAANMLATRQPDYCSEVPSADATKTYTCGRTQDKTCVMSQVVCRHNSVIEPAVFFMLDSTTGAVVSSMDSMNSTQVTYWSNLVATPTLGQFGDAILLPARGSCPDNNDKFPAVFGTAPVMPATNTPTSSSTGSVSSSTGPFVPRSSSSTGAIQFGAASSSIPALSAIIMLLPAVMTAVLRV